MINSNEVYLICDQQQRLYYTGYNSSDGYLVLGQNFTYFVIDNRYYHAAQKILSKKGIKVILGSGFAPLFVILKEANIDTIGIDFTKTSYSQYRFFEEKGFSLKDISLELTNALMVKTPDDLKKIKKACQIAQTALKQILPLIKEGITETQLAAELEYRMRMLGAYSTSFDTIVAFGKNSAIPHHVTGDTVLKKNMPILIDFGCVYKGFCSDMTRTFFYGKPSKEFVSAYNSVLKAHQTAAENIVDGTDCFTADKFARDVLKENKLDEYFTHSLGHGIGVYIHEAPALSPRSNDTLKERMVFSIEPGVYFNDKFGIRIEDSVTISNGKVKSFMTFTKKLITLN